MQKCFFLSSCDCLSVITHVLPRRSNVTSQCGGDNDWEYKECSLLQLPKLSTHSRPSTVAKVRKFKSSKMPPKSGLFLLFWLQSTFAQSPFFGADQHLPFFSSGFPASPLVHFSQHSGEGQRKYDTIDIVSSSQFYTKSLLKDSQ